VREIAFERVDERPFVFEAGQWVNLFFANDGGEVKRSYSVASPPDGSPRFAIAVTRVEGGPVSTALHDLPIGRVLRATGPSGFFTRGPTDPSSALFVATGTGLAPIRSMVKAALDAGSHAKMTTLLGVRHEADILWADELATWGKEHGGLRIEITLSQPGPRWTGRRGYVQEHVPALWGELGDPTGHLYVCGLERMVKAVREVGRGPLGIDRKHVHHEKYD
jgi:CDP-4-dehydro-6-deoxyglucose reductase